MEFGQIIPGITYRKREAVYAVVLDNRKEKAAIILQNGKGFLPGGGVKGTESHEVCLKRECMEETGFLLNIEQFIGNSQHYFQTQKKEYIINDGYFYTGSFGEYVKPPIDLDHELVWMKIDHAVNTLFHRSHAWAVQEALKAIE